MNEKFTFRRCGVSCLGLGEGARLGLLLRMWERKFWRDIGFLAFYALNSDFAATDLPRAWFQRGRLAIIPKLALEIQRTPAHRQPPVLAPCLSNSKH